jgi:hypothetical protein
MKNKLSDLNNHLFAQLERLSDEDLKGDDLQAEIKRANAISGIASDVIENAKVCLDACKAAAEYGFTYTMPEQISGPSNNGPA